MKFILLIACVTIVLALEPTNAFDENAVKSLPTETVVSSPSTDDMESADTKHKKYGHRRGYP